MNARAYNFLEGVLGKDGARAFKKAVEHEDTLTNAVVPRAILSWIDLATRYHYEGEIPGVVNTYIEFKKSERKDAFTGALAVGDDTYTFENATRHHVAATVAVMLGVNALDIDDRCREITLQRLGKSIDTLVKARIAIDALKKGDVIKFPGNPAPKQDLGQDASVAATVRPGRGGATGRPMVDSFMDHHLPKAARADGWRLRVIDYTGRTVAHLMRGDRVVHTTEATHTEDPKYPYGVIFKKKNPSPDWANRNIAAAIAERRGRQYGNEYDPYTPGADHGFEKTELPNQAKLYHGSRAPEIDTFNGDSAGLVHLSPDRQYASSYGPHVHEVQFSPKSPLDIRGEDPYDVGPLVAALHRVGAKDAAVEVERRGNSYRQSQEPDSYYSVYNALQNPKVVKPLLDGGHDAISYLAPDLNEEGAYHAVAVPASMGIGPVTTRKTELPGQANKPRQQMEPQAPQQPQFQQAQPKPPKAQGIKVTKSQAENKCSMCRRPLFKSGKFIGCLCFMDMAKSVRTSDHDGFYLLTFKGVEWDADAIEALKGALRGR